MAPKKLSTAADSKANAATTEPTKTAVAAKKEPAPAPTMPAKKEEPTASKEVEAVDISEMDISDLVEATADRLDTTVVPMAFVKTKTGAGVTLSENGKTVSSDGKVVGCQLADTWMAGGRKPLVWTCAIVLEEVSEDTTIGVVGRNYFPSTWDAQAPLAKSTHAVMLRCGDGTVNHKGKGTSFILRKLKSGTRLHMILDMQTLEMTIELLGDDKTAVVASLQVENMPSEITLAIGFAASGEKQSVRIVGCKKEKPEMHLNGKLRKDLWDDDNIQTPLALNVREGKERGALQQQQAEIAVAASLN